MSKRPLTTLMIILLSMCFVFVTFAAEKPKFYIKGNVLAAGNYGNSATSSDMTLIIKMTGGNTVYIDEGSPVSYIAPDKDIADWTTKNFNDSAWKTGISGVGYADNDDNTVITGPVPAIYTRYHFDAPNAKDVKEVTFLVDYDDFFILWLNGVEVGRNDSIKNVSAGKVPAFDQMIKAGITDHEATDLAAGKPNAARWNAPKGNASGQIVQLVVAVDFSDTATSVSPMTKLTLSWGSIKSK